MAKLHFLFSVMNAGKSAHLLQVRHNWIENGGNVMLFTSVIDDRYGVGKVRSRIGIEADAIPLRRTDDILAIVKGAHSREPVTAVLVDEVQFMTAAQAWQLSDIVDELGIPVMAYGLKNNAFGQLFSETVHVLMALADDLQEIKQLCHCGRKATMILRYNRDGIVERAGEVVEVGSEGRYVSVCRPHWKEGDIGPAARRLLARTRAAECGEIA
jgi:Thymidine kinase